MFKKSKLTDWIIAGSVAYVAYHAVEAIHTVKEKIEEVSEAITRPAKVVREKFSPKKSESTNKFANRVSSMVERFRNK